MSGPAATTDAHNAPRWGFCPACSLWRFSTWLTAQTTTPGCPVCATAPSPLESLGPDGIARTQLELELPPGAEIPLLS